MDRMAASSTLLLLCSLLLCSYSTAAAPRKLVLVQQPPLVLKYHNGPLLRGNYTLSLLFYGRFSAAQRSIVVDFVRSLSSTGASLPPPSVASWWRTTARYAGGDVHLSLGPQLLEESYSKGKLLSSSDVAALAGKAAAGGGHRAVGVVVTDGNVAVEGFCSSRCGTHGRSRAPPGSSGWATRRGSARASARGHSTSRSTGRRRRRWSRPAATWGWTASSSTSRRCWRARLPTPTATATSRGRRTRRWRR
ncbi:unnamed protein product [Musa textilis]